MADGIEFKVYGRYALFTDPVTRLGGEKASYSVPTYQALKGIVESIYWKPTIVWVIDDVRVMNRIAMQPKGIKTRIYHKAGSGLSYYTYLTDVCYQVRAHFEFNLHREDLKEDRDAGKHLSIARRMVERGGRRDIFLGTRECQGYIEPAVYGEGKGYYDNIPEMPLGTMFHGFNYPDETGKDVLQARLWSVVMQNGKIHFLRPEECRLMHDVHKAKAKHFDSTEIVFASREFANMEAGA